MGFIAHSENKEGIEHNLEDHLYSTATLMSEFAKKWRAEKIGIMLGLLHDIGKYSDEFQSYVRGLSKKRTDHATAAALIVFEDINYDPFAFVLAGHHGGMQDTSVLKNRIKRKKNTQFIRKAIEIAEESINYKQYISNISPPEFVQSPMIAEFFARMCFSELVDADFLDTESHFESEQSELRNVEYPELKELWTQFK